MLRRFLGRFAATAAALLLAGPASSAQAQDGGTEEGGVALLAPHGLDRAEARNLSRALSRELSVRVVHAGRVGDRLAARAAEAPGADVAARVDAQERAAMDAYVHLRFAPAEEAFSNAIDATLEDPRRPADAARMSRLLFGRALVGLAAQRGEAAAGDLATAITLDPELAPDRDEYGPPVLRAVAAARREVQGRAEATLTVDRSPEDATVWVDGREVPAGEGVTVRAGVRHLLTAARPGHTPRSRWVDVPDAGARAALVLPRVRGSALSLLALGAWESADPERSPSALDAMSAPLVARAIGAERAILARREGGEITLTLLDTDGGVIRTATGDAVDWEVLPYTVLTALLAGRTLTPPSPAEVTLTVSAPNRVGLGEAIGIRVQLRDPEQRVVEVAARCDDALTTARLSDGDRDALSLMLDAPVRETELECLVRALDSEGRALGSPPDALRIEVTAIETTPIYASWYFWSAIGLVVAGGVAAAILVNEANQDPQQVLTIHGP